MSETWPDVSEHSEPLIPKGTRLTRAFVKRERSKYHREIKPGVWVDVYDVLMAFGVTNPADAHAIKKMLMPGKRGNKDAAQDRAEAIQSLQRAQELEQ